MSELAHCPRGAQEGIFVGRSELLKLNRLAKSRMNDEFIPLPSMTPETQAKLLENNKTPSDDAVYWECEDGSHGWCCNKTGIVIQWG